MIANSNDEFFRLESRLYINKQAIAVLRNHPAHRAENTSLFKRT